ncbi:GatB/YqeY domain-containing protein [Candidatus Shapirobacteria bacterium]|nr:GatB/YqeY domain-containing protein [Candidatus Shapirobacteria bacterium]
MATLKDQLKADLNAALKAHEGIRVSTLRFLFASLHNLEIARQKELEEEEVIAAIQKQAKDHEESIAAFKQGNRQDLVDKEEKELAILRSYLPAQLSADELGEIIDQVIKEGGFTGPADFGKVMGQVMDKVRGRASGDAVAAIVKDKLKA